MLSPSKQDYIQQVSIDCVIFGYQDKQLKVLVLKLNFAGELYALPGGFILQHDSIDQAARRILEQRTGLTDIYLEQFRVFGEPHRTNNHVMDQVIARHKETVGEALFNQEEMDWLTRRFISIGYYALVDINKVKPVQLDNDKIYDQLDESYSWCPIKELPTLIIDHNEMVQRALETLQLNLDQKLIAFNLLPETFTMKEVQELYEAIYDKPFARNNFQKKILDLNVLERLEKKFTGAANKAPYLYRFLKEVAK